MQDLSLIVFDDAAARRWEPFALTRPVGELLFGTLTLRARVERILGGRCAGHLAADHLAGFEEPGAPPVLHADGVPADLDRLYILSRFVPDWPDTGVNPSLSPGPLTDRDGRVVGWYAAAGGPGVSREFVLQPQDSAGDGGTVLKGRLLENVWDLLPRNPDQISKDIRALFPDFRSRDLPAGVHGWGDHPIIIDPTARVEPGAVFDASDGPIWIDGNAHVRAFTRLVGPAYVGVGSRVLGGPVESVSIGPVCRVRGELAESVCLGYTNKQHDGHMGHAYLGRWVNLGAETTNSDLKNNYGTIRVWTPDGERDTGEMKMGSLIGDHVKTGIGLLLNTGTVIGAGSNLYGAVMPPKYVPPFSWGTGSELAEYQLDKFLETAERAMGRRQVTLSPGVRAQLTRAWERGRSSAGTN